MTAQSHLFPARGAIVLLTLLTLLLGGATHLWEQALFALLAGGLILLSPPSRRLRRTPYLCLAALLLLGLAAFLPASWSSELPWRSPLIDVLHLNLPPTRTPQPWLTLQACSLLVVGCVWIVYVLAQRWSGDLRLQGARILIFGVAVLAAVAIAAFAFDFHFPGWNQEENRGWFPNRNQTADVLAICGVVNYAMIFDCLRKRRASLYLWLATLAVIDAALIVSYSRAGVLMFFGGLALWHVWPVEAHRRNDSTMKWVALSLALVFVLLTLFFLFGGRTLERFDATVQSVQNNRFRWAIQQDAFRFSGESPLLGVGLGNFEPLFASARHASANADRALHPESDWLWTICEMGWFAPLAVLAGLAWWLRSCVPFRAKSGESLRRAFTVGGVLFILHGLVDVSAHRLGSLCVGLLVFSLALPSAASHEWYAPRLGKRIFRLLGAGVLLIGGWWAISLTTLPSPPTTARLEAIEEKLTGALAHNDLAAMQQLATAALAIAPLDWHLYFQRAYAQTFSPGQLARASEDFRVARFLESKWVKPCFDEGATWLAAGQPDLCIDAWSEALRRTATPADSIELYREMLELARGNEMVHHDLLELARGRLDLQLVFLDFATDDETRAVVSGLLARDPSLHTLDRSQREHLFANWSLHGDRAQFVAQMEQHPGWLEAGWASLAQAHAAHKDYRGAWSLVARWAPSPLVPVVSSDRSLAELQTEFDDQSDSNLASGILLYTAQVKAGLLDDALATLRILEKNKNCPRYLFYLESKTWASKQDWELAWTAWWNYHQS